MRDDNYPRFVRVRGSLADALDRQTVKSDIYAVLVHAEEYGLTSSYYLSEDVPVEIPNSTIYAVGVDGELEFYSTTIDGDEDDEA